MRMRTAFTRLVAGHLHAGIQSLGISSQSKPLLRYVRTGFIVAASLNLMSCGGKDNPAPTSASAPSSKLSAVSSTTVQGSITSVEASRFLSQATFGATDADIANLRSSTYSAWLDAQIAMPTVSHLAHMDDRLREIQAVNPKETVNGNQFYETVYQQAATGQDQLRQRVKLALSEIFVTSFAKDTENPRGLASYYDMLGRDAFGNFRTLLTDVTYHPAMGIYLSYMGNQKEDSKTGRSPDQNYAREIMQLMTIGLYQLNTDGTPKTDLFGNTIPTYSADDILGLSKVFTGLSWYSTAPTSSTFWGNSKDTEAYTKPMTAYDAYHSTSAKAFLGTTIPASATPDTNGDVKVALDTLFNNPNVGPFISKQLIQHLVTSNPSAAYVGRVAAVFNNNGSGVRGDMAAVIKAILLDNDARSTSTDPTYGKLREPFVRVANWMRSFGVTSQSGNWLTGANLQLGEAPLASPTVFNFFRPGYVPPNTVLASKNKVGPVFEISDEGTIATYVNFMQSVINYGVGFVPPGGSGLDIKSAYTNEVALADNPTALVDRIDLLLAAQMSTTLKAKIVAAVSDISIPTSGTAINTAKLNRVRLALLLSMASPEYLAQR